MSSKNDVFSPFLDATRSVFMLMFDISEVDEGSIESFKSNDAISICIGVTGDLVGNIIYRFPKDTSISMVNIMSGMEISDVDDFVTSAISEIANIISGNVLTMFTENNIKCDILPPVLGAKEDGVKYTLTNDFCVSTSIGVVCIDIRLNQKSQ